jgi:hypothetical protein
MARTCALTTTQGSVQLGSWSEATLDNVVQHILPDVNDSKNLDDLKNGVCRVRVFGGTQKELYGPGMSELDLGDVRKEDEVGTGRFCDQIRTLI